MFISVLEELVDSSHFWGQGGRDNPITVCMMLVVVYLSQPADDLVHTDVVDFSNLGSNRVNWHHYRQKHRVSTTIIFKYDKLQV